MKIVNTNSDYTQNYGMVLIYCTSSETKPTLGIVNGSICYEMNTKKYYCFDEGSTTWKEITIN